MALNQQGLERAVTAALQGPGRKDIRIDQESFNVDHAKVTFTATTVAVDGSKDGDNISHRKFGVDDQIYYKFTVRVGQDTIALENVSIKVEEADLFDNVVVVLDKVYLGLKWVLENIEKIKAIIEIIEKIIDIITGEPTDGDFPEEVGQVTTALRSESALIRQETDNLLDGTWKGEAQFIIVNVALAAAALQVFRVRPPSLPGPGENKNIAVVADPGEPPKLRITDIVVGPQDEAPPPQPIGG